ncbi:MAG: hypothetical protein CL424_07860, partial [Acidimicrobiaceae bacterium]|nr:hypothetical protein [Acidimicrobiaceae bacterium]
MTFDDIGPLHLLVVGFGPDAEFTGEVIDELDQLAARGTITGVGRRIGVGKESDVHCCQGPNGETFAIKLHRLGRISFRAIKS